MADGWETQVPVPEVGTHQLSKVVALWSVFVHSFLQHPLLLIVHTYKEATMSDFKETAKYLCGIAPTEGNDSCTIYWDSEGGNCPFANAAEKDEDGCYELTLTKAQAYAIWSFIDCAYDGFDGN